MSFDQFWSAYPNRKAKKDAEKAWSQVKGDHHIEAILQAIEKQSRSIWAGEKAKFVPMPATWLRGERWQDEIAPVRTTSTQPRSSFEGPAIREQVLPRSVQAGNRLFLNWLRIKQGVDIALVPLLVREKNRLVRDLDLLIAEKDSDGIASFPAHARASWDRIADSMVL
jgi:hypothetical protein